MSDSRERILARIRNTGSHQSQDTGEARAKISLPEPIFRSTPWSSPRDRFVDMLGRVQGTYTLVEKMEHVPDAVSEYLGGLGSELIIALAPHPDLAKLDWHGFDYRMSEANRTDRVPVTRALAAIAETGTLALASSSISLTSLNFLPDVNIAVVCETELVSSLEDFWGRLNPVPRALNFITGPSKTADIEQTIVYGAHGPRRLHVILVSQSPQ